MVVGFPGIPRPSPGPAQPCSSVLRPPPSLRTDSPPVLRSLPHLLLGLFATAALGLAPGCSKEGGGTASAEPKIAPDLGQIEAGSHEAQREIRDLITAVTPLPAAATITEKSAYFPRRKETLERLREGDEAIGWEALRMYDLRRDAPVDIRKGLLDVAAHVLPEETSPILVELITTFGDELGLRAEACQLLAGTSPEIACEVLEGILSESRPRTTYPPQDQMLKAWIRAAKTVGLDRAELLSTIAVDLRKESITRTLALRELGEFDSNVGRQALEQ